LVFFYFAGGLNAAELLDDCNREPKSCWRPVPFEPDETKNCVLLGRELNNEECDSFKMNNLFFVLYTFFRQPNAITGALD
jgi:hypothetical protein